MTLTCLVFFSGYLYAIPTIRRWKTHSNYLMPVYDAFTKKNVHLETHVKERFAKVYSKIRKNTENDYIELHFNNGTVSVEHSVAAAPGQYEYISYCLFLEGNYYLNSLMVTDFHSIGRITEASTLKWSNLELHKKLWCLKVKWYRKKNAHRVYNLHLCPSPNKPWRCVIFALGAMMRMNKNLTNEKVYPEPAALTTVNTMLKKIDALYKCETDANPERPEEYNVGMTSHSARASAIELLEDYHSIKEIWVDSRAGFQMLKQC